LADMDRDGIEASVIYGPITGLTHGAMRDVELRHACHRAYNDWAGEFNAPAPRRLCVLALLPADDPATAAAEVERVAALGLRGVQVGPFVAWAPMHEPAGRRGAAARTSRGVDPDPRPGVGAALGGLRGGRAPPLLPPDRGHVPPPH